MKEENNVKKISKRVSNENDEEDAYQKRKKKRRREGINRRNQYEESNENK